VVVPRLRRKLNLLYDSKQKDVKMAAGDQMPAKLYYDKSSIIIVGFSAKQTIT
jgi:hypothetical protein